MKTPRKPENQEMRNGDDELTALYRKAPRLEPDARIDDLILRASRRAVVKKPRAARPFSARWQVPVSIAAVILIAVVLAPALYQHTDPEGDMAPTATRPAAPVGDGAIGSEAGPPDQAAPVEPTASPAPMMPTPPPQQSVMPEPNDLRSQMRQSYSPAGDAAIHGGLSEMLAADDDIDDLLARIRELLEEGDIDAAQREFARLRLRYPDATVDSDLMQQLYDP
jgi:hypothetical protein